VGPDLSTIGDERSIDHLLESLLSPSVRIEPRFASYVVNTTDGRSITGLLARRDASETVLKDGEGKEFLLAADEVEQLRPLRISLMPDGQMANLTAQEAADLLAYLASRRRNGESSSR
jgi:putative heme-binding domain-containing protein